MRSHRFHAVSLTGWREHQHRGATASVPRSLRDRCARSVGDKRDQAQRQLAQRRRLFHAQTARAASAEGVKSVPPRRRRASARVPGGLMGGRGLARRSGHSVRRLPPHKTPKPDDRGAGLRLAAADHLGSAAMPELTAAQRQKLEKARELVGKAAQRDAKVADRDLYDRLLKQARAGGPAAGSKCPRSQQPVRPQCLQRPATRLGGEPLPFGCKSSRGEPAAEATRAHPKLPTSPLWPSRPGWLPVQRVPAVGAEHAQAAAVRAGPRRIHADAARTQAGLRASS